MGDEPRANAVCLDYHEHSTHMGRQDSQDGEGFGEHNGIVNNVDDELLHFQGVLNVFTHYKYYSLEQLADRARDFSNLPSRQKELLVDFSNDLAMIRCCIEHNAEILKLIANCISSSHMFQNFTMELSTCFNEDALRRIRSDDMDKVRTTMKQIVRDWSSEGMSERDRCYLPVIEAVQRRLPPASDECSSTILVPGAGLARLVLEFASRGYHCQGNEFSAYMLFASHFILNKTVEPESLTIYPWVHSFSNNYSVSDQTRPVRFPDICPSSVVPPGINFSMSAGDFLEAYTDPCQFDCVASVFFIDTGHNIIDYIERIYSILKPGGFWVNLGPLLYHFADVINADSIELSYEQLKLVILGVGFIYEEEKERVQCPYVQNHRSMLSYNYECVYFVVRKPVTANKT